MKSAQHNPPKSKADPRRWPFYAAAASALAVLAALAWFWLSPQTVQAMRIDATDPALIALGQEIYAAECASCHGAELEGQPDWQQRLPNGRLPAPPHDQSGHTWHHPDAVLFDLTKYGPVAMAGGDYVSDMPAFETILTDAEIMAAIAFIKSTWPEQVQSRQNEINERAQ